MAPPNTRRFPIAPVTLLAVVIALMVVVLLLKASMQQPDPMHPSAAADQKAGQLDSPADADASLPQKLQPITQTQSLPDPLPGAGPAGQSGPGIQAEILKLDNRFRAESRDPKWAAATESGINAAIVGSKHDGFDVPPPDSLNVNCRTSLCNIRMEYADVDDAAQMQSKLMLGIPSAVSKARIFLIPGRDGGTEVVIFAGNENNLF